MTRIVTVETRDLEKSAKEGGCGECRQLRKADAASARHLASLHARHPAVLLTSLASSSTSKLNLS